MIVDEDWLNCTKKKVTGEDNDHNKLKIEDKWRIEGEEQSTKPKHVFGRKGDMERKAVFPPRLPNEVTDREISKREEGEGTGSDHDKSTQQRMKRRKPPINHTYDIPHVTRFQSHPRIRIFHCSSFIQFMVWSLENIRAVLSNS